jgi:hypothetical protein
MTEARGLKKAARFEETVRSPRNEALSSTKAERDVHGPQTNSSEIEKYLEKMLKFKIAPRTRIYVEKRFGDINSEEKPRKILQKLFSKNRLLEFTGIFKEITGAEPFTTAKERNIDLINALNFSIFCKLQGRRVAREGLRAVLKWRKDHSR